MRNSGAFSTPRTALISAGRETPALIDPTACPGRPASDCGTKGIGETHKRGLSRRAMVHPGGVRGEGTGKFVTSGGSSVGCRSAR